jgi:uridine phosphorylase
MLRLGLRYPNFIDLLGSFSYGVHRIVNFEMETSAMYGLAKLLGHQCLSVSAVIANRAAHTFSKDAHAAVENTIQKVLEAISVI